MPSSTITKFLSVLNLLYTLKIAVPYEVAALTLYGRVGRYGAHFTAPIMYYGRAVMTHISQSENSHEARVPYRGSC